MDKELRKRALASISSMGEATVNDTLDKEVSKISAILEQETNYDVLKEQLELLEAIFYRVPEQAVRALDRFLLRLETLSLTYTPIQGYPEESLKKYKNNKSLTVKTLGALENLRYLQTEAVLDALFRYTTHDNPDIRKQALHGLGQLSEYNLEVWQRVGYVPQQKLLAYLKKLPKEKQQKNISGIVTACTNLLSPQAQGTTMSTYKTVTWSTAAMPVKDELLKVRADTLAYLQEVYNVATSDGDKLSIIDAVQSSTRTPSPGGYDKESVLKMLQDDAIKNLNFYKSVLPSASLAVIQKIEQAVYWLYRRFDRKDVSSLALELKDFIDKNNEYQIFSDLVGHYRDYTVWRKDGEEAHEAYKKREEARREAARKYASGVTEKDFDAWKTRIGAYIKFLPILNTNPYYLRLFFEALGKEKPELAYRLLAAGEFEEFFPYMMGGILQSSQPQKLDTIVSEWISNGQHLFSIAKVYEASAGLNLGFLERISAKAIAQEDKDALNQIMISLFEIYDEDKKGLIKSVLVPTVKALTALGSVGWLFYARYRDGRKSLIDDMQKDELSLVIDNFVHIERIDYGVEAVLVPIAKKYPDLILELFRKRIESKRESASDFSYDAVPYELYELGEPLKAVPELVVKTVLSWYNEKDAVLAHTGGRLVKTIFSEYSSGAEKIFIDLIHSKDERSIQFVLHVLAGYEGQEFIHAVSREIVKALPEGHKLLSQVMIALQNTGVTSGEFGHANALEERKRAIEPWLKDDDEKVRKFAKGFIEGLEDWIKHSRERAKEDLAIRKYEYGDDDALAQED